MNSILFPSYTIESEAPIIGHIVCKKEIEEIKKLLNDYTPIKIRESNVEMTITLDKDQKVFARARCLPFPEKKGCDETSRKMSYRRDN